MFMLLLTVPAWADSSFIGTWFFNSAAYTKAEGVESAWGNTYPGRFDFVIEPATESESANWDLRITNLCNQGRTYGGTLSEDGKTLTVKMVGNAYFSDRDYSDKGTESLGGAEATIMGEIALTLQEDGSMEISEFTVINTKLAGAPSFTELVRYKENKAVPYTTYHYAPGTYTAGEASGWGNTYPEEFDVRLRKVIENTNYSMVADGFGGVKSAQLWGDLDQETGVISFGRLTAAYLTDRDYSAKGTESLGDADGGMMGGMTLTPNADKGYDVSDFTIINLKLAGAPVITVLGTYQAGKLTLGAAPAKDGDVNGDGAVTIKDVVSVLELMASDSNDPAADINGDGAVTIKDVVAVLEIMAAE